MPRVKPACVRRVSIGESSGSCSEDETGNMMHEEHFLRNETHMCPRCHEQFQQLQDFLLHKRICDAKALQMGEDRMHSDPEDMVVSGDDEMDEPNKRLEQVRRHRQDAENNNSVEEGEAEVPEADVPPIGFPFAAAGHVTLEALQNTKVAVAQFAATAMANNANNEAALQELAVLQSTLFTLQHQQVFQLQLIRQLQSQLSLTRRKPDQNDSPPPAEAEVPAPVQPARSPSPPRPSPIPTPSTPQPPTTQSLPPSHSHLPPKTEPQSIPRLPSPSPPMMSHPPYSSISSSLASSIITNNDPPPSLNAPNTLEMLQKRAQEVLDNASQGLLANNLADELAFRKSGKMSPYDGKSGGRNEPFFKHRCRYCGKVFGSDSALQIHIRSHTGERPFKCNVCGSRFTTKGNLKVHFQRHSAKFPHVKMNPNPVPEHLDKYHPPLLAQLSPGPIPGMPPHPMFPPGGPGPFPPGLPLYRPSHHDLLATRPLGDKPIPQHPLFGMREEQDAPADLSKPSAPSSPRPPSNTIKSEPQDDESQRDSSFNDIDRVTPKREPDDNDAPLENDNERYPSPSPYDECSTDSKYSNEDQTGRESPLVKLDPDQPENLSSKSSSISGQFSQSTVPRYYPYPVYPTSPSYNILNETANSILSNLPFKNDTDLTRDPVFYNSLLPRPGSNDNSWESLIEVTKCSETNKLQQLVDNFEYKLSDPNQCIVCNRVLSCKSALQMHYRIHTGERPFRCKLCGRAFTTKGNLKTHMGVHRIRPPQQIYPQCPVCHKKFSDATMLKQHVRIHTGEPIDLPIDQIRAAEINDMPSFKDQLISENLFPFMPPIHSNRFSIIPGDRRADFRATDDESGWEYRDASNRDFEDDSGSKDCTTSPLSVSALTSEAEIKIAMTTASLPSVTGSDGGSIRTSPALSTPPPRHLHRTPPLPLSPPGPLAALGAVGGSPFSPLGLAFGPAVRGNTTCNICYKTFACNSALEIHYRSHTKERPFKCSVCDRGFSTKSSGGGGRCRCPPARPTALNFNYVFPGNMKQHMLTHKMRDMPPTFEKPSVASSITSSEEGREPSPEQRTAPTPEKHETLKRSPPAIDLPLPKRPSVGLGGGGGGGGNLSSKHLCGVCRKNFSSSSALQIHMRTHTGDKPFRCAVCQKAFTTKGNLKVHMGTHMWSSGASRRGRRMSLELPPRPLQEPHELLRRPDLFYPYLPAPFLNGMQQKLNEISVIQQSAGQNGIAKFPGLLGFGPFGARAGSPLERLERLERPPSEGGDERAAALRELAERGRAAALSHMEAELQYGRPPAPLPAPLPPTPDAASPPAHPTLPLLPAPTPARSEGLTV